MSATNNAQIEPNASCTMDELRLTPNVTPDFTPRCSSDFTKHHVFTIAAPVAAADMLHNLILDVIDTTRLAWNCPHREQAALAAEWRMGC
jgi:hypothetical protein